MLLTVSVAVKQFVSFTMRGPLASQPPCVGLKDLPFYKIHSGRQDPLSTSRNFLLYFDEMA